MEVLASGECSNTSQKSLLDDITSVSRRNGQLFECKSFTYSLPAELHTILQEYENIKADPETYKQMSSWGGSKTDEVEIDIEIEE